MSSALSTLLSFLFVGALWGCTNPLIKQGSDADTMYVRKDNSVAEFANQVVHLVKNWKVRRKPCNASLLLTACCSLYCRSL